MSSILTSDHVPYWKSTEDEYGVNYLADNHIGCTLAHTYVFYTDYADFDNAEYLLLRYKSDTDAYTAESHFHINHSGTDYDLLYKGAGIGQSDTGEIYILGVIKVAGNYINVCVKIDSADAITYKELPGTDDLQGYIGDTLVYVDGTDTLIALCRCHYLYNFTDNTISALTVPANPLTEKLTAQPFWYYPKDDYMAYCGFYGFADDRTNISTLNYYFLTYSFTLHNYAYVPFKLDFEPDLVSNLYNRYRILQVSQDGLDFPLFLVGCYSFQDSLTGDVDDEFPVTQWNYWTDYRIVAYWVYQDYGKNTWSMLQKYDQLQPTDNYWGIVLASARQREISTGFYIGGATYPQHPFYPDDTVVFTETTYSGNITYCDNRDGNFAKTNTLALGQWVCTNRYPWTCKAIVCYAAFNGWKTFAANDHIPAFTLTVNELNTAGYPPKPIYLSERTYWELSGFKLYCGYSGYFNMKAKEITIYNAAGAVISNRTVTDTNRWIEILPADSLVANTQYYYKVRYQDTCDVWGSWSELKSLIVRDKPAITVNTVTDTQFPVINFTIDSYGSLITDITIEIYLSGGALWDTIVIADPYNYTDGTGVFEYTVLPNLYSKLLSNATAYDYKVIITNEYGKTNSDTETQTTNFVAPAVVTNLTATDNLDGTCTLAWNTNRGYVFRDNVYIGVCGATYEYDDIDCTLNTEHTYKVCAYDPVVSPGCVAAGIEVKKTLTTNQFALCSASISSLFSTHVGNPLIHVDNVKYDRMGNAIFVDFQQGSCSITGLFTRAKRILLEAGYRNVQFYLKYSTYSMPVVITGFSSNYIRTEQLEGISLQMEKVEL